MRAAVYHSNADVRLEDIPVPSIGAGELLLRVEASGICGSDVLEWYRLPSAPRVLGHEVSGVVEAIGSGTARFAIGDRVMVTHHVPCNACRYCRTGRHTACDTLHSTNFDPGGFAEFIRVPAINVERGALALPDDLTFEQASFIEPLGCAVRGLDAAGGVNTGETALVVGTGVSGLLFARLCRVLGAGRVLGVDTSEPRRTAAAAAGVDAVFAPAADLPDRVRGANGGHLPDLVIVAAGASSAVTSAFDLVDRGGRVLLFAPPPPEAPVPFDLNHFWSSGVTVSSTYAAALSDLDRALDLLASGAIDPTPLVTHRLPLDRTGDGFRLAAEAGDALKVIIEPNGPAAGPARVRPLPAN